MLNAKFHAQEATIIAQAGRKGGVTVATNMAGRGTDILLGGNPEFLASAELHQRGLDPVEDPEEYAKALEEVLPNWKEACDAEAAEVIAAGGLYVLGTERHDSRRIDNQLRGRSGRQGDPGESRFYLSLQDDLMKRFRAGAVEAVMERFNIPEDVPIESKMVTRQIRSAQTQIEGQNAEIRKNVLKYDEVLNKQRQVIYAERKRVLNGEDMHDQASHMIDDVVTDYVTAATADGYAEDWDLDQLWTSLKRLYPVTITIEDVDRGVRRRAQRDRPGLPDPAAEGRRAGGVRGPRGGARRRGDPRAGAPGAARGDRPQVARAPVRDGLPAGRHQPAGVRPARPGGRVPARGLRHVQPDDGGHQGGGGRLPLQPGGPGRGAAHRHRRPEPRRCRCPAPRPPRPRPSQQIEVRAKGLGGGRRPQNLQYTAPAIDGEAGDGAPVIQQQSAPALGIGAGGSPVPAGPAHTSASRRGAGQPQSRPRPSRAARPATRPVTAARARSTSAATAPPAARPDQSGHNGCRFPEHDGPHPDSSECGPAAFRTTTAAFRSTTARTPIPRSAGRPVGRLSLRPGTPAASALGRRPGRSVCWAGRGRCAGRAQGSDEPQGRGAPGLLVQLEAQRHRPGAVAGDQQDGGLDRARPRLTEPEVDDAHRSGPAVAATGRSRARATWRPVALVALVARSRRSSATRLVPATAWATTAGASLGSDEAAQVCGGPVAVEHLDAHVHEPAHRQPGVAGRARAEPRSGVPLERAGSDAPANVRTGARPLVARVRVARR